jgi:hypothetical protein
MQTALLASRFPEVLTMGLGIGQAGRSSLLAIEMRFSPGVFLRDLRHTHLYYNTIYLASPLHSPSKILTGPNWQCSDQALGSARVKKLTTGNGCLVLRVRVKILFINVVVVVDHFLIACQKMRLVVHFNGKVLRVHIFINTANSVFLWQ